MKQQTSTVDPHRFAFDDLALAAAFVYSGQQIGVEPPTEGDGFVTFSVERTPETEQFLQDYVTSSLRVDPRRYYDALGIAKRIVHKAKEVAR